MSLSPEPPSYLPPQPTPLVCYRAPSLSSPYSKFPLAIYFMYGSVSFHVTGLFKKDLSKRFHISLNHRLSLDCEKELSVCSQCNFLEPAKWLLVILSKQNWLEACPVSHLFTGGPLNASLRPLSHHTHTVAAALPGPCGTTLAELRESTSPGQVTNHI